MKKKVYFAGTTRDNQQVFYTSRKFHQLSDEQKNLITEILPHILYKKFPFVYTFSFNRIVGSTSLVEVEDYKKDSVFWVYRKSNTKWKVPVLFSGVPRMTTYMTLLFKRREGKVFIVDCFFGKRVPPLPANPDAIRQGAEFVENCQNFWDNHALIMPLSEININKTIHSFTEEEYSRFIKLVSCN